MLAVLRDKFLMGCVTLIIIVMIASGVFLTYTGKGSDVRAIVMALVPGITTLITFFGLGHKTQANAEKLDKIEEQTNGKEQT